VRSSEGRKPEPVKQCTAPPVTFRPAQKGDKQESEAEDKGKRADP
jgi:hypothetical protein